MPNTVRADNKTKHKAIELRHRSTPAEARLWRYLRGNRLSGFSFRRQHAIGPFIADFCCIQAKLIIELDGGQHIGQAAYDADRTVYLQSRGYRVLRFWNNDVENNPDAVLEMILHALETTGKA